MKKLICEQDCIHAQIKTIDYHYYPYPTAKYQRHTTNQTIQCHRTNPYKTINKHITACPHYQNRRLTQYG